MEGYFPIKVTPLGTNIYLSEEMKYGEISEWSEVDVDRERVTWIICFGIHCHAWNTPFCEFLAKMVGMFICSDDNTMKLECMDVARFLVRTRCTLTLNETFKIKINEEVFIKVVKRGS